MCLIKIILNDIFTLLFLKIWISFHHFLYIEITLLISYQVYIQINDFYAFFSSNTQTLRGTARNNLKYMF
jgi:hypothetical protein